MKEIIELILIGMIPIASFLLFLYLMRGVAKRRYQRRLDRIAKDHSDEEKNVQI